jgi:hypothetical protein
MGIREAINGNPKLMVVSVLAIVGVALGVAVTRMWGNADSRIESPTVPLAWYTVDDGKTWFAGPGNKVTPFEHEGKTAVRCYLWTCDGGKTKFVSHLERLGPTMRNRYGPQAEVEPWKMPPGAEQVKLPNTGDTGWIGEEAPQASQIMIPRCPDGKGKLEAVLPEQ